LDELVSEDYAQHSILGVPQGREGVRQFFEGFTASFPDFRIDVRELVAEGDRVFLRAVASGTWKGFWNGKEPNGRKFEISEFDEFRLKEGIVMEHWDALDTGKMAQDLDMR
jgi:predicted SnoaL-like aldol condensation-catalyzing enzyme